MPQPEDHRKAESLRRVAGDVSRETVERLLALEELFLKWAGSINLVSPNTLPETWERHILDSAQLWRHRATTSHWLDLGSGSGFPGLVLAVLGLEQTIGVTLVESNAKKSAYLRQAASALGLKAEVLTTRVEGLEPTSFASATVTARAFAPLDRLLFWTNGLHSPHSRALLHKGRGFQAEVLAARGGWDFDLVEQPSLVDSQSVILDISNVRKVGAQPVTR